MTNFWFFVHMIGLVVLAVGVGIANLSGISMGKADSPRMLAMWSAINIRAERMFVLPGALILIIAGTILVHEQHRSYGAAWIAAAYVLWVVAVGLGGGVLGRHAHAINHLATEEVAAGVETSTSAAALARSPKGPVLGMTLNVIVLVFLALMVFKPGG
jgi:uncharacterized membrane protein